MMGYTTSLIRPIINSKLRSSEESTNIMHEALFQLCEEISIHLYYIKVAE